MCQELLNSGNLFLSTILIQKLLTECFLEGVRLYSLVFLPLLFLFFVWVTISYQLQKPIQGIWINMVHLSMQWLPEIWQLVGGPFCELQIAFFKCKVQSKTCQFGKPIFFSHFWSKSYLRIVFLQVSAGILFSSSPCFSFFLDVCLGCHQFSAAGIHSIWMSMVHLPVLWLP